jgi:nitrogen-specific signal transduction histidine kinase/CheY-like chemotaxis protein
VLSIGLDVTDAQRTEEMLVRSQKMEAVGRLTGGIAHDFNNLLMGVLGCCRMAIERIDEEHSARPLIEEIARSAERSVQLTRRLLTFSRREPAARCVVDVLDTVRSVCGITRQLIGEDISLSTRFSCAQALVEGDPTQLEQALMNLVINARDAMPGGGDLSIRVREDMAPSPLAVAGHVTVEVEDTGSGMTPEVQQRLFEPFFTTKPAGQGTGLGLPTVFGIVSRMHGQIDVQSAPGLGTRFRITLPRTRRPKETETGQALAPRAIPQQARGETVLLVEDEAIVRLTLQDSLRSLGYQALVASDAGQALEMLKSGARFDVMLTDVVLPGRSGPELAALIRKERPFARVVFMSAHDHEHLVQAEKLRQSDLSLEKPFSLDLLAVKLRQALDNKPAEGS